LFPHSHTFLCVLCSLFSKPFNQGSISNNHFTNTATDSQQPAASQPASEFRTP
jgi:hypothetical protein